jgi:hypothetical protein
MAMSDDEKLIEELQHLYTITSTPTRSSALESMTMDKLRKRRTLTGGLVAFGAVIAASLTIGGFALAQHAATQHNTPTPSVPVPTASSSPVPSPQPDAKVAFETSTTNAQTGATTMTEIHVLDPTAPVAANDRVIATFHESAAVITTGGGRVFVTYGGAYGEPKAAIESIDVNSGATKKYAVDGGGGAAVSPDGSTLVTGPGGLSGQSASTITLQLITLSTGNVKILHLAPISNVQSGPVVFASPERWTPAGITVSLGYPESAIGTFLIDPVSGKILASILTASLGNQALSPDGKTLAFTSHQNLGDAPFGGQGDWPNTLNTATVGGSTQQLAAEKNHDFAPLAMSNDGRLLVLSWTDPGKDQPITADMGLLLEQNGATVQIAKTNNFSSAIFVSSSDVLLTYATADSSGNLGPAQIQLLHLCPPSAATCSLAPVTLATFPNASELFPVS